MTDTKPAYSSLAAYLKATRTTQQDFSRLAGVSQPVISRIVNRQQFNLDVTKAHRIAQLAGVPVESLTKPRVKRRVA
jgi:transcriptional regulator with XRE-family HTH domain